MCKTEMTKRKRQKMSVYKAVNDFPTNNHYIIIITKLLKINPYVNLSFKKYIVQFTSFVNSSLKE